MKISWIFWRKVIDKRDFVEYYIIRLVSANQFHGDSISKWEQNIIKKIGGSPEVKQHLENLGFVVGGTVTIVNTLAGNLIVNVKETRVAISEEMARKIMI